MDGDIEERMVRLENRMKTNFFEIEKRLVNLETSSPAALSERIQELEDLLLLLQLENMRTQEKISSDITQPVIQTDLEERIRKLELSKLPNDVGERLNHIEDKVSSLKTGEDEFLEGRLDEIENRLSATGKIYREISDIERRLGGLEKTAPFKNVPRDIESRLDGLSKSMSEEMDKRLLEINNKIDRIEVPSTREEKLILKSIEDRTDELEKNISLAVEESENISKTFESRLSLLERESRTSGAGLENIEKKLNSLERQLSLLDKDANKIDFFSKELSEIDKRLNLLELRERPEKGEVLNEVEKILGEGR